MSGLPTPKWMEGIEEVALRLALRRPSALQRFEDLCKGDTICLAFKLEFQGICN